MNKIGNSLSERFNQTAFGQTFKKASYVWKQNKKTLYFLMVLTFILSTTIVGALNQFINYGKVYIINSIYEGIIYQPVSTLLVWAVMFYLVVRLYALLYKGYEHENERNYEISHRGTAGTAKEMNSKEAKEYYNAGTIWENRGDIIGAEDKNLKTLYSMNNKMFSNGNEMYIGTQGTGKSTCGAINKVFQCVLRGESMAITDPKGEIYGITALFAKAMGYKVRYISFNPDTMYHSDCCDLLSSISSRLDVINWASTFIENTGDEHEVGFWKQGAQNLLCGFIFFLKDNPFGYEFTISDLVRLSRENALSDIDSLFSSLPYEHPARPFYDIFSHDESKSQTVKASTYGGLGARLLNAFFGDPLIYKVVGTKDFDFTEIGRQKGIVYVGMRTGTKSLRVLSSLFFNQLTESLQKFGGEQPERHLPVRVRLLLDEFYAIGEIPNWLETLAVLRSYWIDVTMMIQDIPQVQERYQGKTWQTLFNACSLTVFLGGNAPETTEYLSEMSGDQTVVQIGKRYEDSVMDVLKLHPTYMVSESETKRKVFTPHEIRTLEPDKLIAFPSQKNAKKMYKYFYTNHPVWDLIKDYQVNVTTRMPEWLLNATEIERESYKIPEKEAFESDTEKVKELTEKLAKSHVIAQLLKKTSIDTMDTYEEDDESVEVEEVNSSIVS